MVGYRPIRWSSSKYNVKLFVRVALAWAISSLYWLTFGAFFRDHPTKSLLSNSFDFAYSKLRPSLVRFLRLYKCQNSPLQSSSMPAAVQDAVLTNEDVHFLCGICMMTFVTMVMVPYLKRAMVARSLRCKEQEVRKTDVKMDGEEKLERRWYYAMVFGGLLFFSYLDHQFPVSSIFYLWKHLAWQFVLAAIDSYFWVRHARNHSFRPGRQELHFSVLACFKEYMSLFVTYLITFSAITCGGKFESRVTTTKAGYYLIQSIKSIPDAVIDACKCQSITCVATSQGATATFSYLYFGVRSFIGTYMIFFTVGLVYLWGFSIPYSLGHRLAHYVDSMLKSPQLRKFTVKATGRPAVATWIRRYQFHQPHHDMTAITMNSLGGMIWPRLADNVQMEFWQNFVGLVVSYQFFVYVRHTAIDAGIISDSDGTEWGFDLTALNYMMVVATAFSHAHNDVPGDTMFFFLPSSIKKSLNGIDYHRKHHENGGRYNFGIDRESDMLLDFILTGTPGITVHPDYWYNPPSAPSTATTPS